MADKKKAKDLTQVLEVINAKGDQGELRGLVEEKDKDSNEKPPLS